MNKKAHYNNDKGSENKNDNSCTDSNELIGSHQLIIFEISFSYKN